MTQSTYAFKQLPEEKVFKDPIHRYIHVKDQLIWDLIKTKEFQRLRRIKQLGTLYLSFHTAEHSRFGHSLGVYEIVRRMIDESFFGREAWDNSDRPLALCAALLHDLGHGPFSHSFEKIFGTDHEAFTQAIITGDTEVNEVLSRVDADFPQEVADVINKTHDNKLVISMISSQIDADRMDYLQRDAYFTGVSYGQFDMERILRLMRPSKDEVLIKESGMHAVESFIMSRYQMYWQIYFHPVSRGGEVLLNNCLRRAKQLYDEGYQFTMTPTDFIPFFKNEMTIQEYVDLDEAVVVYYLKKWIHEDDPILSDLSRRFINRDLFKYMPFDGSIITITELTDLFVQGGIDPNYYFVSESFSDLPYDYDRPGSNRQPIHLLRRNGKIREISSQSLVISSITGINREDYKLYYPKELIANIEDDEVRNAIIGLLNELN
ncbi:MULTISPECIES: HD domain-containing protein [Staphylococcus]|uniref:Deoxyguanosinetriphosphate triphosphohydrolase n=1 Tax=Staphylococcus pettenkoferi TaxID=170573 RepID=A0A2N6QLX7_9STAP|nr:MULTISPECIES: HD domain-containing protein [Staphylococcus]MBX8992943.1 HD domain-containing protein [Staphylococcus pettenkoferi]MCI2790847.1 HD domain-containing protein [Staphylococcus pettenkoferi]MCY1566983.1 HD domain-containing protein [Staphylococcus pettenkoferi]MCY1587393.1 HD domain-containing protein [Staphylococcus pettenkoferi]MCY1603074.1 HD domain-containing protein [Staphylococcus pettenkoferi]